MIILGTEKFFNIIKDGAWHRIDVLSNQLGIQTSKLTELSEFLFKRGIVKYEEGTHRIKIQSPWNLLLPEEEPF